MTRRSRVIAILFGSFFLLSVKLAISQESNEPEPFFRVVEIPLSVAVVHAQESTIGSDFYDALISADVGGLFDDSRRARSFGDANLVVFIVENWTHVEALPFQEQLSYVYGPVSELPESITGFSTRIIATDGTQIGAVFLAEDHLPTDSIGCGVRAVFLALTAGFDFGEVAFHEQVENC